MTFPMSFEQQIACIAFKEPTDTEDA